MSLLLDALKKAAEQKAQKSQPEAPEKSSSDETLIRADAADVSDFDAGETGGARDDETDLDHTEIRDRIESDLSQRIAGDETGFDIPDTTDTRAASASASASPSPERITGDETSLDIPDEPDISISSIPSGQIAGDETSLDIPDATDISVSSIPSGQIAGDETSLDIPQAAEADPGSAPSERDTGDDTGLDIPDVTEARAEPDRAARADAEDTGLDIPGSSETRVAEPSEQLQTGDDEIIVLADEDVTDFADVVDSDASVVILDDETDISLRVSRAHEIESSLPQQRDEADEVPEADEAGEADAEIVLQAESDEGQDLSLLLVEQTDLNPTQTSLTDPNAPPGIAQLTAAADDSLDGVGLVETTDHRVSGDQTDTESTAITSPTAAIGYADDTGQTPAGVTQSTLTREATSTHTYAPDNYDRTLMKPPSDDASKIFAGMKSDADVVMTPDYAKKVFRSKTSAQRVQHLKIYGGIAIVILLGISVYGLFEYQAESEEIDTSLRSLKRDPMPGVIRIAQPEEAELFIGTDAESSARTIEIIETANEGSTASEATTSTQQPEVVEDATPVETAAVEVETEVTPAATTETAQVEPRQTQAAEVELIEAETADNLHIELSSQVSQNDIWTQEAYAAYQSGNNRLAMERYNQVLEVDPRNRNALLARAAINVQDSNAEAAIRDYRSLLLANPKDSLAMSSLLTVSSYSPEDIESQLKLMIRDEPESPYLNFALANAYGAQNRWQEAQGYYFKALQNNPGDPNYAYNLAVSLEHISQPRSAITYYQRALENFENGLATFSRDIVDQRLQLLGKL